MNLRLKALSFFPDRLAAALRAGVRLARRLAETAAAQRIQWGAYEGSVAAYAHAQRRDYGIETAARAALTHSAGTVTTLKPQPPRAARSDAEAEPALAA
jgi:hypothetical protein